jgi:Tfp pilus assembly protein PilN
MKSFVVSVLLAAGLVSHAVAADPAASAAASSDKALIDYLIRQDQLHTEEIARLKAELARPKTRQEAFAACMQAARGQSALAAESIGEHCDKLLK